MTGSGDANYERDRRESPYRPKLPTGSEAMRCSRSRVIPLGWAVLSTFSVVGLIVPIALMVAVPTQLSASVRVLVGGHLLQVSPRSSRSFAGPCTSKASDWGAHCAQHSGS